MKSVLPDYDLWSSNYDSFENPMILMCENALDESPLLFSGKDVTELGCGTGRNLARILKGGARSYTGLDGSSGMLEQAQKRHPDPRGLGPG